jgi:hypothetical protein
VQQRGGLGQRPVASRSARRIASCSDSVLADALLSTRPRHTRARRVRLDRPSSTEARVAFPVAAITAWWNAMSS